MKTNLSPIVYLVVRVHGRRRRRRRIVSRWRRRRRAAAVGRDQIINKRSQVREARVEREAVAVAVAIVCFVLVELGGE